MYTERIVAFIDILGFKKLVESSLNSPEVAERIYRALQLIYGRKKDNESDDLPGMQKYGVEVAVFSDSVVISYPLDYSGGLFFVLLDVIHLQLELMCLGILIRGGIAIGPLYHSGQIVYGPAMNQAYHLESVRAVYPRIILDGQTVVNGILRTCAQGHTVQMEAEYVDSCIRKDVDGFYYLDILRQDSELSDYGDEYYYWLENVRKIIVGGLNDNMADKRVYAKYVWLKNYFNEVVSDKEAFYPTPETGKQGIRFRKAYMNLRIKRRRAGEMYYQ